MDRAHEMLDLLELDAENWQPRPRDTLVGQVLIYDLCEGRFGTAHTVLIREVISGKIWRVWRTTTVLLQEFRRYKPRIGEAVDIRYHGRHPEKSYPRFKRWVDRRAAYDCPFTDEARALDEQADDGPPFRAGKTRQTPLGCTVSLVRGGGAGSNFYVPLKGDFEYPAASTGTTVWKIDFIRDPAMIMEIKRIFFPLARTREILSSSGSANSRFHRRTSSSISAAVPQG